MGRQFLIKLNDYPIYRCRKCGIDLTYCSDLESTAFRGRLGSGWLFSNVFNVHRMPCEDRAMTTGIHTIAAVSCNGCHADLGWRYEQAYEISQQYKRGKYILEKELIELKEAPDDQTFWDKSAVEYHIVSPTNLKKSENNIAPSLTKYGKLFNKKKQIKYSYNDNNSMSNDEKKINKKINRKLIKIHVKII